MKSNQNILFSTTGMRKIILLFFVLVSILSFQSVAFAQFSQVGPTEVSVETVPEIPGPNTDVKISVESYGTDLNSATISWYLNGKQVLTGKGQKVFYFRTGSSNTTTAVKMVVTTDLGEVITKTYQIKPSSVDIIWQNDGYVPPFYKGKALFSYQNKITFVAIPHIIGSNGREINPNNLIYKWTKNGTVLGDFSGYGKNTYTMISTIIARPLNIEVEVTSPNSDDVAYSSVYVAPIDPTILMYEKNPLYGFMFEKALVGDIAFNNLSEVEVAAVPYFFGTTYKKNNSLPYKWSINYNTIDGDVTKTNRVFRPRDGASGTSFISVSINNTDKVLQSATSGFNLQFNNAKETESPSL